MPNESLGQMPAYFADVCVGAAVAAAATTQIFSVASGCLVGDADVDYLQLGLYQIGFFSAMLQASDIKAAYNGDVLMTRKEANDAILPCVTTFPTADSHYITMLGPNVPKDLPHLLSCVSYSKLWMATKVPWALLRAIGLWAQGKNKLEILWPFGNAINGVCIGPLAAMTLTEFEEWCQKSGWTKYAVLKTVDEAFRAPHTVALGLFVTFVETASGNMVGKAPINIRAYSLPARL